MQSSHRLNYNEVQPKMDSYIGLNFDENLAKIESYFPNVRIWKCNLGEFGTEQYCHNTIRVLVNDRGIIERWQAC